MTVRLTAARNLLPIALLLAGFAATKAPAQPPGGSLRVPLRPEAHVIPQPADVSMREGNFSLTPSTRLVVSRDDAEILAAVDLLNEVLARGPGYRLSVVAGPQEPYPSDGILISVDSLSSGVRREAYTLDITPAQVRISAGGAPGVFYALQTLLQLMPSAVFDTVMRATRRSFDIPCLTVHDLPRFPYRGMHLDVSRHFFPVSFIKRYLDLLAMHKFNVFHWHLTDDNGWRLEIRKFPKLASVGAWRVDRSAQPWRERQPPQPGEPATYGGFYTQEQVREVVAYAAKRQITVIPEIEMPGHSSEVLAAYPELSCTGGPFYVQPGGYWPNVDIFCAGNDEVFGFIEGVLDEVVQLFPAPYIHLGGDEAAKDRWRACPRCQLRIRAEGLQNEGELQSYFMKRVEAMVRARGRTVIGWDEILEGGLPPSAVVMSWRGFDGGIAAAMQGHDVIMTPTSHCYFDYYQARPAFEPEAIGGLTTLREVYSFEPVPGELAPERRHHILGAQGNLWTEFIPAPEKAEYMAVPRLCALAEVVWSPPARRSWPSFRRRLTVHEERLNALRVNYSRGSFRVSIGTAVDSASGAPVVVLSSEQDRPVIRYTLDGTDPTRFSPVYDRPLPLPSPLAVCAAVFDGAQMREEPSRRSVILHPGMRGKLSYDVEPSSRYGGDRRLLIDGITGSTEVDDGTWAVFPGTGLKAVLTLAAPRPVKRVVLTVLVRRQDRIRPPADVLFEISADGTSYTRLDRPVATTAQGNQEASVLEYGAAQQLPVPARFVRVTAKNPGPVPAGEPGEGQESILCFDELIVE